MRNLSHRWQQIGRVFPKPGHFFQLSKQDLVDLPRHFPIIVRLDCIIDVKKTKKCLVQSQPQFSLKLFFY